MGQGSRIPKNAKSDSRTAHSRWRRTSLAPSAGVGFRPRHQTPARRACFVHNKDGRFAKSCHFVRRIHKNKGPRFGALLPGKRVVISYWGGCVPVPLGAVVPAPVPAGLLPLPMLPLLPMSEDLPLLLPPQVSEIMSTLVTLKVFSLLEAPVEDWDMPAFPPFSHVPFTATSWPTCAETSCPLKATSLPFLVSRTYWPPCDCTQPFSFFSLFWFEVLPVWSVCPMGEF